MLEIDNYMRVTVDIKGYALSEITWGSSLKTIKENAIVFGIGPAGTGKTYLAVAMAVKALRSHEISRIILTRPAVEAGEKLGFLPGDLQSKIDPYLRPLYDALYPTPQLSKGSLYKNAYFLYNKDNWRYVALVRKGFK